MTTQERKDKIIAEIRKIELWIKIATKTGKRYYVSRLAIKQAELRGAK